MSLYNMLAGYNPACWMVLPMLGKHPKEYPRFRDCFIDAETKEIIVYTRVGGDNRNSGFNEEELYKHPNFIRTYDDDYDSTYGYYVFSVPDEWKEDFERILKGCKPSEKYINYVCSIYPKVATQITKKFSRLKKE